MARIDSYYTDTLTVSGQVSLESQIISNVAFPTLVGSTVQMTSDQYLVAFTIATASAKNVILPPNPTIGETHIIKSWLVGAGGGGGSIVIKVSGTQKIDGRNFVDSTGFSTATINSATGGSTNGSITLLYASADLWFVIASVGNINYSA